MGELYLALTDGTTTVTIADGSGGSTAWQLRYGTWGPMVAQARVSQLGGNGPYDDVTEQLVLNIYGANAGEVYANLKTLIGLLDQARRWSKGERVAPVLIQYSPVNAAISSTAHPLQAVVLDYDLILPPNFQVTSNILYDIKIKLTRRGLWLHVDESYSSVGGVTTSDVFTTGFASAAAAPSPTAVQLTNVYTPGPSGSYSDGMLVVARAANQLAILNAESIFSGTGYSSVNDSSLLARNNNVLRYTPAGTTETWTATYNIATGGAFDTNSRRVIVLASVRNNSGMTTFKCRAGFNRGVSTPVSVQGTFPVYTPQVIIDPNDGPRWIVLGMVALDQYCLDVSLGITADAASGTLDIDSIALLAVDSVENSIVTLHATEAITAANVGVLFDHRALTGLMPICQTGTIVPFASPFSGDAWISTSQTACVAAWLQTGSEGATKYWRAGHGGALLQNSWMLTRTRGYVTPC